MNYRDLYADEVDNFLKQPGAIALDMRDHQSYLSGHLPGAERADEQCVSRLIRKRTEKPPVLIYCYHGVMRRDFAELVRRLGFEQVYHLVGGYRSWSQLAGA